MNKKESRQFNISVEGAVCEKLYFEHLALLINNSSRNIYNMQVKPKKMSPLEYAKRNAYKPVEKRGRNKAVPYIHIQDIEDYYDDFQRNKFYSVISEMRTAENKFGITYELGYTNYTFELWMLLHVTNMKNSVRDRFAYLGHINRYFNKHYTSLDEFKKADEFQEVLSEYITLDSVIDAVKRAESLVLKNEDEQKVKEEYKGVFFYRDNPDVSVHEIVKMIFEVCGVK